MTYKNGQPLRELRESQRMEALLTFKPEPLPTSKALPPKTPLKKITWMNRILKRINQLTQTISNLVASESIENTPQGVHDTGLALTILDFIRTSASFLWGIKIGESRQKLASRFARVLFSGSLLGLTIAAFVVAGAAAPIGLALASLGVGYSFYAFGKIIYNRHRLQKELKNIELDILEATNSLNEQRREAKILEDEIAELNSLEQQDDKNDRQQRLNLLVKIFDEDYARKKEPLSTLYKKKFDIEKQLTTTYSKTAILGKVIGFSLALTALAGIIVAGLPGLMYVGGIIVAAGAIASAAVLVVQLFRWGYKKYNDKRSIADLHKNEEKHDLSEENTAQNKLSDSLTEALSTQSKLKYSDTNVMTAKKIDKLTTDASQEQATPEHSRSESVMSKLEHRVRLHELGPIQVIRKQVASSPLEAEAEEENEDEDGKREPPSSHMS